MLTSKMTLKNQLKTGLNIKLSYGASADLSEKDK